MARYRIGNDITIIWTVNDRNGAALPLADKDVRLFYTCERGRYQAEITIQDTNKVVWDFCGGLQKALGGYSLTLEILQSDGKRSIKKDVCGAFILVGKDCEADAKETTVNGEIAVYQEMITTNLDIARISPIIPVIVEDENGVGYWYVDGVNTGERATGESAYDYAVSKGYEGTEEEYAELLAAVGENISDLKGIQNQIDELSNKIVPSDWLAEKKDDAGYIKNRTHYVMGNVVTTLGFYDCPSRKILFQGNVVELPEDGTVLTLIDYADKLFVKYIKGAQVISVFNVNSNTGESNLLRAIPIKIISEIVPLPDMYIPETIARKSEISDFYTIKSINADALYNDYVGPDAEGYVSFDIQIEEGQELWDAIMAGKKISIPQGVYPGYVMVVSGCADDYAYLIFPYLNEGYFRLDVLPSGATEGSFTKLANGLNFNEFLERSTKIAQMEQALGRKLEAENIATINGQSITTGGNITIEGRGGSDIYLIQSFNLIWLYDTYVWADGDKNDIADIQFKIDEGKAIWDAIRAGKKIAVKMGDDTVHGYGWAITAYTDDVSYLTFQYEDVGCFSLGIDTMGGVGGYFYRSVTASNLETFLAKSPKLAELSAEIGKKQNTITDLETIRSGAAKGATALQSVPATYATKTDVSNAIAAAITTTLNEEV